MSVVSWREILPRTFSHSFGNAIECERTFAITLDGPTNAQECLNSVGIKLGDSHPEYPSIYCLSGDLTESDFYHAELTVSYGVVDANAPNSAGAGGAGGAGGGGGGGGGGGDDGQGPVLNPLNRADVWNFSSSVVEVPVTERYDDGDDIFSKPTNIRNNTGKLLPIVNTAGDAIWSGLTKSVGQTKLTIKGNRSEFSWGQANSVTGTINDSTWLNSPPGTWLCQGISGTPQVEQVGDNTIRFWEVNVELLNRSDGFFVPIINQGMNSMELNAVTGKMERRRVFVKTKGMPDPGVPCDLPVALDEDGMVIEPTGSSYPFLEPLIMYFRVHRSSNFASAFGSSPPNGISA